MPLFWRIFLVNALALVAALIVLLFSPITISTPVTPAETAVLLFGFAVLALLSAIAAGEVVRGVTVLREAVADDEDEPVVLPKDAPPELIEVAAAHNRMIDRMDAARDAALRGVLIAQEAERARWASELEAGLMPRLTELGARLDALGKGGGGELSDAAGALHATREEVGAWTRHLRPGVLEELGLKPALIALMEDVRALGVQAELEFPEWLPPDAERDLGAYRIVEQAISTAIRCGGASDVVVTVHTDDGRLVLTVGDDGDGRNAGSAADLASLRERARLLGGALERTEERGVGSTVECELPLVIPPTTATRPSTTVPTVSNVVARAT